MQDNEVQISDFKLIISSASLTLYWLIVGLSLVATILVLCFPQVCIDGYLQLGNKARAYDCAVRYNNILGETNSVEKTNNLIFCINTGSSLMIDPKNKHGDSYNKDLIKFTNMYFNLPEREERTKLIDEYNISSSPKELHPNLYSYEAYLSNINYRAHVIDGDYKYAYMGDDYVDLEQAIYDLPNICNGVENLANASMIFSNLSVYIDYRHKVYKKTQKLDFTFLTNEGKKLYNTTKTKFNAYVDYAITFNAEQNNSLQSLFFIKSCEKLVNSLKLMIKDLDLPIDDIVDIETLDNGMTLTKFYYDILLSNYCK